MWNKAQVIAYDFVIATSIFFITLIIVFSYWVYAMKEVEETRSSKEAMISLLRASNLWFIEGYPKYWDNQTVLELGLSNDRRINATKVEFLNQMGYQKVLSLLNLGRFNVFYNVTSSGSVITEFGAEPQNAKNIYKIVRFGVLENKVVRIETILWE